MEAVAGNKCQDRTAAKSESESRPEQIGATDGGQRRAFGFARLAPFARLQRRDTHRFAFARRSAGSVGRFDGHLPSRGFAAGSIS